MIVEHISAAEYYGGKQTKDGGLPGYSVKIFHLAVRTSGLTVRPLELDETAIVRDRAQGLTLRQVARTHQISTATVRKVLNRTDSPCVKRVEIELSGTRMNTGPKTAA